MRKLRPCLILFSETVLYSQMKSDAKSSLAPILKIAPEFKKLVQTSLFLKTLKNNFKFSPLTFRETSETHYLENSKN